jgi:hypothetical protein
MAGCSQINNKDRIVHNKGYDTNETYETEWWEYMKGMEDRRITEILIK